MSRRPLPDDIDHFLAQRAKQTPGVNTEPMAIFGRINRIAHRMTPHMEALFARHDLERGEFDVLATLERNGPPYTLSPTDLYRSLMITSGGLTHRLNQLESRGYITRKPSADDGRSLLVRLTAKGLKAAASALVEDMTLEMSWLSSISSQERALLASLLRRLYASIPECRPGSRGAAQVKLAESAALGPSRRRAKQHHS
jgi:DNA-binding MarR family transcriptional regulator